MLSAAASEHAHGSVQSLLTSLARDRDEAKAAAQKMSEASHELRLEVSKVSGQLAVSMSDKERVERDLRAAAKRAAGLDDALRASEREGIVREAEVRTQRDETHALRREVAQLRDAAHEADGKAQAVRLERDALREQCAALEAEAASLEAARELGVQEARALRDSMAQLTAEAEAARREAADREAALQRRAAEMDLLSGDIARTKERLEGEQRERGEAESALQELLSEVRQLSGEKDRERASRSAAELDAAEKDAQLAELQTRLRQAEAARAELEAALRREADARTGCEEGLRAATRLHEEDARKRAEAERDAAALRASADGRAAAEVFAQEAERRTREAVARADAEQQRADRVASEAAATLAAETQRWGDRLEASQEEARKCREDTQLTTHALKEEVQRQQERLRVLEREAQSRGAEAKVQASEIRRLAGQAERAQSLHERSRTKVSELQDALRRAIAAAREANGRVASVRGDLEDKVRDFTVIVEQLARAKADAQRGGREAKTERRRAREMESRVGALEEELEAATMARMGLEGKLRSQERQGRATHTRLLQELEALKGSYHQFIELSKEAGRDLSGGFLAGAGRDTLAYSMGPAGGVRAGVVVPGGGGAGGGGGGGGGGGVFYSSEHNSGIISRIASGLHRGGGGGAGGGGGGGGGGSGGGGDIKITKGEDGSLNLHLGRR